MNGWNKYELKQIIDLVKSKANKSQLIALKTMVENEITRGDRNV